MRFPLRSRRSFRFLAPGAALVLLLSAGAFAAVETESVHSIGRSVEPLRGSTVGFVGAAPVTAVGKVVSAALMVLGFVLLATTTAAVASFFVREDELPEDERELGFERDVRDVLRDLDARLEAIEGGLRDVQPRDVPPARTTTCPCISSQAARTVDVRFPANR